MSTTQDLNDVQPIPPAIRRACIQTSQSASDPASIPVEAAETKSFATAKEIASMAAAAISDLSERTEPRKPRKPPSLPSPSLDLVQHQRRCAVCKHPEREAIEEAFLQWRNVFGIATEFGLPNRSSVYRHAHAFGLFPRRQARLRFALEHVIEGAESVQPNASAVVDAVRAYAHLDDSGRWIESPTTHFVVGGNHPSRALPALPVRNTRRNRK
jgi:hypothetical protein